MLVTPSRIVSITRAAPGDPRRARRAHRARITCVLFLTLVAGLPGCATRTVRHPIYERNLMEVDLVRDVAGMSVVEKSYEHPTIISVPRLVHILTALEVEVRGDGESKIRQPAFHPDIVERTAEALAMGLAEASANEEVAVKVTRKQMRLGIFHKKFLTAFLAYVKDDHLYVSLRRVEWPIPRGQEDRELPHPIRNRKAMDFRVVTGEPIYFAGVQDLEIDWQSDVFRQPFRLSGSTDGKRQKREILDSIPVPKEELEAGQPTRATLEDLTATQLRALADLEEDRRAGKITETEYQRARRQLLRER